MKIKPLIITLITLIAIILVIYAINLLYIKNSFTQVTSNLPPTVVVSTTSPASSTSSNPGQTFPKPPSQPSQPSAPSKPGQTYPTAPTLPTAPTTPVSPSKSSLLKLGELGVFQNVSIRPISVEEDSRCPIGVLCIQAGTVRLKIQVITSTSTYTNVVSLGQEIITASVKIKLTEVTPIKRAQINIKDTDYRFKFSVQREDAPVAPNPGDRCFVGGCSSQVCSDRSDVVTTCEYSAKYACYQTAKCERQSTGECGWTPTPELNMCLQNNQ